MSILTTAPRVGFFSNLSQIIPLFGLEPFNAFSIYLRGTFLTPWHYILSFIHYFQPHSRPFWSSNTSGMCLPQAVVQVCSLPEIVFSQICLVLSHLSNNALISSSQWVLPTHPYLKLQKMPPSGPTYLTCSALFFLWHLIITLHNLLFLWHWVSVFLDLNVSPMKTRIFGSVHVFKPVYSV